MMQHHYRLFATISSTLIVLALVLAACTTPGVTPTPDGATPTSSLPTPAVNTTAAPDARAAVTAYLTAWQANDLTTMYNALTRLSRDAISLEDFTKKYNDAAGSLTMQSFDFSILSTLTNVNAAQVAYEVTYHTALLEDLTRQMEMPLVLEDGAWKIQWSESLILPELTNGSRLALDLQRPARGSIYDRNGYAMVAQTDAVALGVVPGEISSSQEATLLTQLAEMTGRTPQSIKADYEYAAPGWYIAVGETTRSEVSNRWSLLSTLTGLRINEFNARYYFDGGIAPHVTGYVLGIPAEELDAYKRKGYLGDEKVGWSGLEKYGEDDLMGKPLASLYVVDSAGQISTRLAESGPVMSESITTTIDADLQLQAQKAIMGFRGAVVVMERDTGRVLAMASSPGVDPNLFTPNNYNSSVLLEGFLSDPAMPLLNRAAQSSYPLGSVFKIVTMAAALESGLYTPETTYDCQATFTELPGEIFYDWTVEKEVPPSGLLTLQGGLMRSCNPWFYHIGLDLYRQNRPLDVANMARAFGLGSATGIAAIAEDEGSIPDPVNEGDAVQLAIGQGAMLVTPLQVADFIAAVGNGGTLYRPQVIESITNADGVASFTFTPEVRGTLPLKPENLAAIQEAMRMVVADRLGTARRALLGLDIPVYGKTGTATFPNDEPHAWFGGYTNAARTDRPDIAVVVLIENIGDGSEFAAPVFRRVVESYFYGKPITRYPWESDFNVTRTPTPNVTETPTPNP
jgi:penicillin-binding protein 2